MYTVRGWQRHQAPQETGRLNTGRDRADSSDWPREPALLTAQEDSLSVFRPAD